jgi:hypothetical protein
MCLLSRYPVKKFTDGAQRAQPPQPVDALCSKRQTSKSLTDH